MINLAKKLNQRETDADKVEFVKGAVGLDKNNSGLKKFGVGFITGALLSKQLRKNV